ncbi:DUF2247 family protein [Listeria monocytogenes]|nr:DUF2247 family protein [Listeria monocytogenes]
MDLSFLKYDVKGEMERNQYSWQEISFALENKIINTQDAINYAIFILDENVLGFEIVLEMTSLDADEDICPYIETLVRLEEHEEQQGIIEKWMYLILKWLYENRSNYEDVIEIVEELYESFGYPESIVSFVRYMPSEAGDLGSIELNRQRLFNNWKNYLSDFEEEHFLIK